MWKRIVNWFKDSNRWKHAGLSVIIGLLMNNLIYTAICATLVGIALEYKDKAYNGKWDWVDLTLTVVPGLIINGLKMLVMLWIG